MFKNRLLMSLWFRASEFRTTDAQPNLEDPLLGFVWLVKMCVDGIFRIWTFLVKPKIHNTPAASQTQVEDFLYDFFCRTKVCAKICNRREIVCHESMEKMCNQSKTGLYLRKHKLFCVAGVYITWLSNNHNLSHVSKNPLF